MASTGNRTHLRARDSYLRPLSPYRPEPGAYQRYLLQDLVDDINSGHNVRSTVFIEARSSYHTDGPEEMRSVGKWNS